MKTTLQAIFGLVALVLLFLPVILMLVGMFRLGTTMKRGSVLLIVLGALLLTLASLDILVRMYLGLKFGAEELAAYAYYAVYVLEAMNYLGLLLIGMGIFLLSRSLAGLRERAQ